VPHISGAEAARAAVEAVRYPPLGDRGMYSSSRASEYGGVPLLRHLEESNREILLSVMIEDVEAVDQIDSIVAVEGVDMVAIGPSDWTALGVAGQPNHPSWWPLSRR